MVWGLRNLARFVFKCLQFKTNVSWHGDQSGVCVCEREREDIQIKWKKRGKERPKDKEGEKDREKEN